MPGGSLMETAWKLRLKNLNQESSSAALGDL